MNIMPKMMLFVALFLLVFLPQTTLANIRDSIQKLLTNHPEVIKAQNDLKIAENQLQISENSFFPKITIDSQHGPLSRTPQISDPQFVSASTLSIEQNFFNNNLDYLTTQKNESNVELKKLELKKIKSDLVLSFFNAYLNIAYTKQNMMYLESYTKDLSDQARIIENKFKQGLTQQKDYLRYQTQSERAQVNLEEAKISYSQALQNIQSFFLTPDDINFSFNFNSSLITRRAAELKARSQKKYLDPNSTSPAPDTLFELIQKIQNTIHLLNQKISDKNNWPKISLIANASYGSSDYINSSTSFSDNDYSQTSLLLNLSWDIWDFGSKKRTTENLHLNLYNEQLSQKLELKKNLLELEKTIENFDLNVKKHSLFEKIYKIEEANLKSLNAEFRSGSLSYYDLTTALSSILLAKQELLKAKNSLYLSQLEILNFYGELNENTSFE